MPARTPGGDGRWEPLRRQVRSLPSLYPVGPARAVSRCAVCRGPVRAGFARCYQCDRHAEAGAGLLADTVVPVSYAVKGTGFAADLCAYKAGPAPSGPARARLTALLLTFLHDHGRCVWRSAGLTAPGAVAVVPGGYGRPGPHPLLALAAGYLTVPVIELRLRPGRQGRDLDPDRFAAGPAAAGAAVLLLEDSWVSGASAQSAAAALRRAGARRVAVVVLGRHVDPGDARSGPLAARLVPARYDPGRCAVHAERPDRRPPGPR